MAGRIDRASRVLKADSASVFAALIGREHLERWLPPAGMSGRFEHYDARPGGSYRMVLVYDEAGRGKTTEDSDVVEARFVDIAPDVRIVQAVDFVSEDPAFGGTMTMTWEIEPVEDGSRVEFRAEEVPEGISAEDHAAGLESSLGNLAAYLESQRG